MDNAELLKKLETIDTAEQATTSETVEAVPYLVFSADDARYAVESALVREILIETPMSFIPFVPPYVRGLINRHGEPYAVLDIHMFLTQQKLEASTYLILNLADDQVAFLITDIVEILRVAPSAFTRISADDGPSQYLAGSFTMDEGEILVLRLEGILDRLRDDAGSE